VEYLESVVSNPLAAMEYCSNRTTEAMRPEQEKNKPGLELADEIYPNRIKSVEEWMHATGYTGVFASFTD
jgi:hypothetical protein